MKTLVTRRPLASFMLLAFVFALVPLAALSSLALPFLVAVDAPSQWTRARYEAIASAEWSGGSDLNLSRRVVRPP